MCSIFPAFSNHVSGTKTIPATKYVLQLASIKIGTRSVHVGSVSEVSQNTANYNYTSLSFVTMLNTRDRNFAVYAQTQANCNVFFYVCKSDSFYNSNFFTCQSGNTIFVFYYISKI